MAAKIIPKELPSKDPAAAPEMTMVRDVISVELMNMEVWVEKEAGQLVRAGLQTTTVVHLTGFTVTEHGVQEAELVGITGTTPDVGIDMLVTDIAELAQGSTKLVVPQVTTAGHPLKHLLNLTHCFGGFQQQFPSFFLHSPFFAEANQNRKIAPIIIKTFLEYIIYRSKVYRFTWIPNIFYNLVVKGKGDDSESIDQTFHPTKLQKKFSWPYIF
jgi:hypothetical protein